MMVAKVRGRFSDFSADIVIAEDPLQSTVNATVQMASIDTGDSAATTTCGRTTSSTSRTTRR